MSSDSSDTKPTTKDDDDFKYNPELNYPMVKLADLPEPPSNWRVCGRTATEASKARKATSEEAKRWVRFHSWGIDMGVKGDLTNLRCFKVLWKLFYYQQDKHRPQNFEQIKDFQMRDAGPRLLQCSLDDPDLLPISRFYPHPPPTTKIPSEGFHRPLDALQSRPDSHIEQMLYPVYGEPKEVNNALEEIEVSPAQSTNNSMGNSNKRNLHLPKVMARTVIEAVERAVMQFAYEDLARHRSAATQDGRVHLTATTEEDLQQANIGSFPATSHVKLATDPDNPCGLIFSADGDKYPYRGRGPVYCNNSSAIDSIIVVGKLLDAGSTVIDRKDPEWCERFTNVEKAFIEATDVNWDLCSRGNSRDRFWSMMAAATESAGADAQSSLLDMWRVSTDHFGQFLFTYHEQIAFCPPCTENATDAAHHSCAIVMPPTCPEDTKGVSMQQLISRSFASEYITRCGECQDKAVVCRRKLHDLPIRLAVTLDGTVPVKKHTRDVSFDYITKEGKRGTAAYRWLGGIYSKDNHYRVYWSDNERGEADTGEIKIYDSAMLSGVIVGGIAQAHRDDKVPESWWKNKPVPLLFYERIMNPDDEVINVALHALGDMVNIKSQQRLLLQGHISWTPSEAPKARMGFPWRRAINCKEDRYLLATGAYDPETRGQTLNGSLGVGHYANTLDPSLTSPYKMNVRYLTSPLPDPEPQMIGIPATSSLYGAPTLSIFHEVPPLLALADSTALRNTEISTQDPAQLNGRHQERNTSQYDAQSSSQHSIQPHSEQYNAQHHHDNLSNVPYQGPYNTQYDAQAGSQGRERYNMQHSHTPYNGYYNIQPSTHNERSTQLTSLLNMQNDIHKDPFLDVGSTADGIELLDHVFGPPELTPGMFVTPAPNPAHSTSTAPTPVETHFNYPHQNNVNEGIMPQYIDPAISSSAPQLRAQAPLLPMDGRRTQPHLAPQLDPRRPDQGSGYNVPVPKNPMSRGVKRKAVDGPGVPGSGSVR
ncbi:uncharacterized protein BDW43DRAFT_310316 [Aspergillus alliaceus]|uniref:uncharacterized protein n=1 Tax=Petromyces alliaceus TaxID=209559 RepID=UPI0012A7730A|nr:uncharacterized protein BDW43DRAFT_310316 [Aspergillus alliaceus]KAB8234288.1 hypothetical protein BDW43DRAFT_310316 [Aspergillus alliaceus]